MGELVGVGSITVVGGAIGVAVGGTGVGVAIGGMDVDIAVGSAGVPPHPTSNHATSANAIICCNSLLLFIFLFLSPLIKSVCFS